LATIVRELVDSPDEVNVAPAVSDGGNTIVLTVRTGSGEVGKVIGRQGKNAQALRTIMEAVAAKYRQRVVMEIADAKRKGRNDGA
jgi:predicted RNA-binding protein YlqC (UPF0109 family)